MKTLQDYIDKLKALNFKDMYENDFFLTWDKTDDELEAIWVLADALRFMRKTIFPRNSLKAVSAFPSSATTRRVPSPSLRPAIS